MKKMAYVVEPNGQNKRCLHCFRDTFYLSRGHSRKYLNKQKTVWRSSARYIYTCTTCNHKDYVDIYNDRITYTNEKDYNKYLSFNA